jgi:SAM-dependent methyltransferase
MHNAYDQSAFFANYSSMPRSVGGLDEAGEWHAFRGLLPGLRDKRLLDLGCGFGWHCRYAREQDARSVIGVDISEKMLARAQATTNDRAIEYRRMAIEDIDFPGDRFDLVISSLALHYVERFDLVCRQVHQCLTSDGAFVFSVEHPMFTALPVQDWCYGPNGERLHWPVDQYQQEGPRHTRRLEGDVVKYHRTIATYVNTLINSGFQIARVIEPEPPANMRQERPSTRDDGRRPMFLLVAALKG